jgi:c(7)-type cytochrome triheme protein
MKHFITILLIFAGFSTQLLAGDIYTTKKLVDDGIHDSSNDAIKILQEPREAMVDFPMDRRGAVDWVKAIREGKVNPRSTLSGGEEMIELDMDIIMKQTAYMPNVRFPHLAHTQWLACSNCHPKIFKPQYEANPVSMEKILKGEFCGRCHDKVSFSLFTCERCHSVPHDESSEAWRDPAQAPR